MADLPVVYEDQDLIVVDKPSGMLSVPGKTAVSSVVELLDAHFGNSARALSVHRLDQATSGLLVVAKHQDAQRELQRMFENRMVEKRYLALIEGNLPADTPHEGTIDLPLRPDLDDRPRQMADHKHGRKAGEPLPGAERRGRQNTAWAASRNRAHPPAAPALRTQGRTGAAYRGRRTIREEGPQDDASRLFADIQKSLFRQVDQT